ncbi:MAG: SRPBCC family protein [Armatimonadota bacterium]|nr:SRPBCC family protein [Armatimonadota bacterium]MDR7519377.1 SRPBCC family protein [Armatimonadota bacterium]MDR7549500.1 SRPBCC family protein [Armatimonadota bacterium]
MHTVHHTRIAAPLEEVFALARDVEAWPQLLREYRWCRVLERTPRRLVFAMGGRIRLWPARWTAIQEARLEEGRITFRHLAGITRGMEVEWRFASDGGAVDVELVHNLTLRWPVIGRLVGDLIVGPIFIEFIARRTLGAVKARAEAAVAGGRTAGRPAGGETS